MSQISQGARGLNEILFFTLSKAIVKGSAVLQLPRSKIKGTAVIEDGVENGLFAQSLTKDEYQDQLGR